MVTPWSVISTTGQPLQAGHNVILIVSICSSPPLPELIHLKPEFKVKGIDKMLTIGNIARHVGVRPSAIRYYERQGIVRPAARGSNGYRIYDRDAVKMLLFLRRAQSLGITLKEIKPLLDLASQGQRPCAHVKHLTRNHLQQIDRQIRALQSLRKELRALLRRRAARPRANEVCPIIERGVAPKL